MPDFRFWWREFEPRRVHVYFFFSLFVCIMYLTQTTDNRQHTSSAGCVPQPAGYNAIHACRLPAEQEATPHACGSLSALYYCGFLLVVAFVIGPCDLYACGSLLLCDTCMLPQVLQHRFHKVVIGYHMRMIQYRMLYVFSSFLRHSPRHVPERNLARFTFCMCCTMCYV